jgi:hypothetical protein
MKKLIPFFAAAALLVVTGQDAEAQLGIDFGPQLSYGMEYEEVALGARVEVSPALMPLAFIGSADYYFIDGDMTLWAFNANVKYTIGLPGSPVGPYFGGGLNMQRMGFNGLSNTESGFNILGGIGLGGLMPVKAFAEARYELMNDIDNQLAISLGILF